MKAIVKWFKDYSNEDWILIAVCIVVGACVGIMGVMGWLPNGR